MRSRTLTTGRCRGRVRADDYAGALSQIAEPIVTLIGPHCLDEPLPRDAEGQLAPDCTVEDETRNPDGSVTRTPLPACEATTARPCFRVVEHADCAARSPDGVALVIDRAAPAPPSTWARVACHVRP